VIDEEQRFGVAQKERIRTFVENVDVLTLTATPIPRTLHMSLLGARDMSVMQTPPRGRYPIRTEIVEVNKDVIRDALLREADRGGQSFFVHNRVESIDRIANYLQSIVPQLRYGVAHGQMRDVELERVMLGFLERRTDVLVTTLIIESGLDIPTVNTMLLNRADALGLAPAASSEQAPQEFSEKLIWDQLRTVYDPEIPVNVVDLGLIYECKVSPVEDGNRIDIKMTMTAPGCGMADVLKADIQRRLASLPTIKDLQVDVVFDPPWNPTRMTEAARLQLGLDLDNAAFPVYG